MDDVVDPVVEDVVEPVVENVVQPVVEDVVEPLVEGVVQPVVETAQPVATTVPPLDDVVSGLPVVGKVVPPLLAPRTTPKPGL